MCRSSRSGTIPGGVPGPRRTPRLSCTWNSTTSARTAASTSTSAAPASCAVMWACPRSNAMPTAGEPIRRTRSRTNSGAWLSSGGARVRRREILERDHQPSLLGPRGEAPHRPLLREEAVLDAVGRGALGDRQAGRVVDDVCRADGDGCSRAGPRTRRRAWARRGAGRRARGSPTCKLVGASTARRQSPCRCTLTGSASIATGGACIWIHP